MSEIRTVEELAALPAGTVLRTSVGSLTTAAVWLESERHLPSQGEPGLTVLYRPDLPPQAELHAAIERVREWVADDGKGDALVFKVSIRRALDGAP